MRATAEQCLKPNHERVETVTPMNVLGLRMAWRLVGERNWQDQRGKRVKRLTHLGAIKKLVHRCIRVVLTAAHLNQTPGMIGWKTGGCSASGAISTLTDQRT